MQPITPVPCDSNSVSWKSRVVYWFFIALIIFVPSTIDRNTKDLQYGKLADYCVIPITQFLIVLTQDLFAINLVRLFNYDSQRQSEVWRYFTCAMVHEGYLSVFKYFWIQTILGRPLEITFGSSAIFNTFLSATIVGSLFAVIYKMNSFCGAKTVSSCFLTTHAMLMFLMRYKYGVNISSFEYGTYFVCLTADVLLIVIRCEKKLLYYEGIIAGIINGLVIYQQEELYDLNSSQWRISIFFYFVFFMMFRLKVFCKHFFNINANGGILLLLVLGYFCIYHKYFYVEFKYSIPTYLGPSTVF